MPGISLFPLVMRLRRRYGPFVDAMTSGILIATLQLPKKNTHLQNGLKPKGFQFIPAFSRREGAISNHREKDAIHAGNLVHHWPPQHT